MTPRGFVEIGFVVRAVVVELRRAGLERLEARGHRRQRLVLDRDLLGGVARLRLGVGDNQRHRIADMAHSPDRQRRPVGNVHRPAVAMGVIAHAGHHAHAVGAILGAGQHRVDARRGLRRRRIDGEDIGMRVRRPDDNRPELAVEIEIVEIAPLPPEQARILAPPDRLADRKFTHGPRASPMLAPV